MTSVSDRRPNIIRTERGLTISGTRITLYDVMDYVTPEERKDIDEFLVVEHIMRLAKAKAHHIIQARSNYKAIEPK